MSNFFGDRNFIPIEIMIDHDLSELEVKDIFESIKNKIGEPCTYQLTDAEREEIENMKNKILELEKMEKIAEERKIAEIEQQEKQKQIEQWVI